MALFVVSLAACHGSSTSSSSTAPKQRSRDDSFDVHDHCVDISTTSTTTTTTARHHDADGGANGRRAVQAPELTVVLADSGAAAAFFSEILFRNDSRSMCEMTGYPGSLVPRRRPARRSAYRPNAPVPRTGRCIAPGAGAYAQLAITRPRRRACPTATAQFVRVYPPNETRPLLIRAPIPIECAFMTDPPASVAPLCHVR